VLAAREGDFFMYIFTIFWDQVSGSHEGATERAISVPGTPECDLCVMGDM
jgi:hypothetical protein